MTEHAPGTDVPHLTAGRPSAERLSRLTGDLRQLASVRGIVLDDGAERGTRALAFSTGGGLDFWALSDRTLDIGPLWLRGTPLAWQHPSGFVAPALHNSSADAGTGIERTLSGLLVTCGLDNVRQPAGGLPLHGSLPFTPVRITSVGEDWNAPDPVLFAEGTAISTHLSGACFRLTRRIEALVGGTTLILKDRIENIGPEPYAMRILYHFNFGYPLVAPGTEVILDGTRNLEVDGHVTAPSVSCHRCKEDRFLVQLRGPQTMGQPRLSVAIDGPSDVLPFVQLWNDPRPSRNILAVEPVNCGRRDDGTSDPGCLLEAGAHWCAELTLHFFA